jgi:hypothetical protein
MFSNHDFNVNERLSVLLLGHKLSCIQRQVLLYRFYTVWPLLGENMKQVILITCIKRSGDNRDW